MNIPENIPVEKNLSYKEDAVTIQCGSRIYNILKDSQADARRIFQGKCYRIPVLLQWRISARRRGERAKYHLVIRGNQIICRRYKRDDGIFLDYAEARYCADKLIQSGNFEYVAIEEEIQAGEIADE